MQDDSSRNTIIFPVCALALFIVYQMFVLEPAQKRKQAELAAHPPAAAAVRAPGAPALNAPPAVTRAAALAASPRVPVATPALRGSISLRGARLDDLFLTKYRETTDKNSPPVEMLRPEGTAFPWFVNFGWVGANVPGLPDQNALWTLAEGSTLAPGRPITLTYANGQGLSFTRRIAVDPNYMFTITDTVTNGGAAPVTLAPYGSVQRQGVPPDVSKASSIVHQGTVGYLAGRVRAFTYKDLSKDGAPAQEFTSAGAWTGITDRYWLAALIPDPKEQVRAVYRDAKAGSLDVYEANYTGAPRVVAPGQQVTTTQHLFAGAKSVPVLQAYQKSLGIAHLDDAVDWGRFFFFLTRPIFIFLLFIYQQVGTFGVAILLLTVCVRLAFFPIANKQYESMTKMKKVQPLMEDLRKRYKDDPAKQQQEIMALYQREKVNPLAGCLPILLQIPVFYSLYKVLNISIEMRHAPFLNFSDLSARDPTTIWNLFGLIPWDPAHTPLVGGILDTTLHLGILPLLYGFTMWLTTSMSPPAGDPAQQRIFQLMPLIFMFIMAPFAVGLLIYWTWSNMLTTVQQYVMMRRFKVDNPIDRTLARLAGKAPSG